MHSEFVNLLDSLANGIVITDSSGTIVYSNPFLERTFGYDGGQLLGHSVEMLLPAEIRERHVRHRAQYNAAPETRLVGTGRDLFARRKDGSVFPVEVGLSPIKTPEGMRVVAIVTDISQRKHAEQRSILQRDVALILSKAREIQSVARDVLEAIGTTLGWRLGSLWLVDVESEGLRNAAFWRSKGIEAPEFEAASRRLVFRVGEGFLGRVWKNGKPEWVTDLAAADVFLRAEEARINGLRSVFELPILVGEETLGVIEFFSYETRPPDKDLIDIAVAVASQIGQFVERKRSEYALGMFEERYRSLFENAVFGIIRATASGEILDANPALAAMLGYDAVNEVLRLNCYEDVHKNPHDCDRLLEDSRTAIRFNGFETEWKTKTGASILVRLSGRAVRADDGSLAGLEAIVENITESKRLEQQYWQAQKMQAIGQLAGGVAHDFNNLLTIIAVSTDSLLDLEVQATSIPRIADEIARAAEQGASLVRQLLTFSRMQPQKPEPVDLNAVIGSSERMLQILAGEDIRLEWNPCAGQCFAAIKASQLEQILMNLVANSRDAMPGGGAIAISTDVVEVDRDDAALYVGLKPRKHVRLRVSDSGHGIPPEVQPRIFEPFFSTKGEDGRGTGLGLSTVYGIVRQHEGHIRCESAPGNGATFTIFLPATTPPVQAVDAPPAPSKIRRGAETVLLIEDEPALRSSVRRILERNGYKVIAASNGLEALRAAEGQQHAFDLLVTDIVLPEMRGTELAERLLQRHPHTRILYMSGYSEEQVPLGSAHFIAKPFRREAFIRKVQEILGS